MNMSQALQNIGANLPNIFRQRQQDAIELQAQQAKQKKDEEDAAQQAELSRIILDLKKGELEQSNLNRSMGEKGRKAVDEFITSRRISNLPISREYGQPLSDVEREKKYNLRAFAPYEPSAKSIVEGIDARDNTKGQRAPGVYGARLDAFNANPNAVPELISSIELAYGNNRLKDYEYEYLLNRLKTDPVQASLDMDKIILGPAAGRELIYEQTPAKIDQKYKLIDPTAATTEITKYSEVIGKGRGESDLPDKTGLKNVDPTTGDVFTTQQKSDAQFALRLQRANKVLDDLALSGFNESDVDKVILSNVDSNGNIKTNAINAIRDPKLRRYAQAKIDFVLSTLRKESGAAINANEYVGQAARYLPQAGDDLETLDQKRTARLSEEAGYLSAAGEAVMKYYQDTFKKVSEERPSPYKKKPELVPSAGTTQGTPDESGFVVGQKKFSKKYGRDLTYKGGGQWE